MDIQEAKAKLVAWANNQVGYREGDNNENIYAGRAAPGYSWNIQNQPWCDIFVDAGFIECFGVEAAAAMTYQPRGSFSALCSASAMYYRQNRAYFYDPELGDQVFFYIGGAIKLKRAGFNVIQLHCTDTMRGKSPHRRFDDALPQLLPIC